MIIATLFIAFMPLQDCGNINGPPSWNCDVNEFNTSGYSLPQCTCPPGTEPGEPHCYAQAGVDWQNDINAAVATANAMAKDACEKRNDAVEYAWYTWCWYCPIPNQPHTCDALYDQEVDQAEDDFNDALGIIVNGYLLYALEDADQRFCERYQRCCKRHPPGLPFVAMTINDNYGY
jgi:hypothetical protein